MTKRLKQWLPILASLALLAFLLSQIQIESIAELLKNAAWEGLLLGVMWYFITNILRAYRFSTLLQMKNLRRAYRILPEMFALSFLNNTLPSRGGELSFPYFMHTRHSVTVGKSTAVLLVARIFDFVAVALLFIIFATIEQGQLSESASTAVLMVTIVLLGGLSILVFLPWMGEWGLRVFAKLLALFRLENTRVGIILSKFMQRAVDALANLRNVKLYALSFAWSILIWGSTFAWFSAFVHALGFSAYNYAQIVVGSTFAVLAKSLPFLTLGGFGAHEAGWMLGYTLVGMDTATTIASGFAVNILTLATSAIVGGASLIYFSIDARRKSVSNKNS